MGLTNEQRRILFIADKTGMIKQGDSDTCPQIHFCPDWDEFPICADSPEAEGCTCGSIKRTPPMTDDLIRRADAINAVTESDRACLGAHGAREAIAALPAVTPTIAEALKVPEIAALVKAAKTVRSCWGYQSIIQAAIDRLSAALRNLGDAQ